MQSKYLWEENDWSFEKLKAVDKAFEKLFLIFKYVM